MSGRASDVDRIGAVVQFDFAALTVLNAFLLQTLAPNKIPQAFSELLKQVENGIRDQDPLAGLDGRANLEQVHSVRNAAQHEARRPTAEEVQDCRTHTRDALTSFCQRAWGLQFDRAETEAVVNEHIRLYLHNALAAQTDGDSSATMAWLRAALDGAIARAAPALVGPEASPESYGVAIASRLANPKESVQAVVRRLQATTARLALGLDLLEYQRFRELSPGAPPQGVQGLIRHPDDPTYSPDELEFAFSYVTNIIVAIEEFVGDLDRPFGGNRPT
jgi:hypothetical protein